MQFNHILTLILISTLLFVAYKRPWVTGSKDFKVTRMFAGLTILLLGIAFISFQYSPPITSPRLDVQAFRIKTGGGLFFAVSSALSWVTLVLTFRGVLEVLGIKGPDQR